MNAAALDLQQAVFNGRAGEGQAVPGIERAGHIPRLPFALAHQL